MRMKQLLTVAVLAMSSTLAMAGKVNKYPVEVTVNADGSGSASGNMATARNSANDVEYIGCVVRATDNDAGGATMYAICQAGNAAGVTGQCWTNNRDLLDIIQNIADYSFITFRWNTNGDCRFLGISTQSFYIP